MLAFLMVALVATLFVVFQIWNHRALARARAMLARGGFDPYRRRAFFDRAR